MLRWLIIGGIVFVFVWFWQKLFNAFIPRCSSKKCLFVRRLSANLVIGLAIAGFIQFFYQYPLIMDIEDASLDFVMQIRQDIRDQLPENKQVSFAFLDVDDQSYQSWGEPLFTPRNHLKSLIDVAVKGEARLVVVDMDLSLETPTEGLQLPAGFSRHPYDQALYDYIANYKTYCQEQGKCPPIILTRVLRPWTTPSTSEEQSHWTDIFRPEPLPIHEIRPSFLDQAADNSMPYVQWGSPLFLRSSYDNLVRRWWLWQPVCENKQPQVLPSLELLTAAMVCHDAPAAQRNIEDKLSPFVPKHCNNSPPLTPTRSISIVENCLSITTGLQGIQQRVRYNLPWRHPHSTGSVRDVLKDKNGEIVLTIFSAQPFLENSHVHQLRNTLTDKIVVIGGSYSDGGDLHLTPVGEMPGGLVVINAIYSLLQGEIKPLLDMNSQWWWGIMTASIVLMSIIFTLFNSFWGVVFSGTLIIAVMVPSSIILFEKGLWLSFTIPLLAVQFHHIAADFHKMAEQIEESSASKFFKWQTMTVDLIKTMSEHNQQFTTELQRVSEENRQIAMELQSVQEQQEQNEQVATEVETKIGATKG